jgi:hypothetical protein
MSRLPSLSGRLFSSTHPPHSLLQPPQVCLRARDHTTPRHTTLPGVPWHVLHESLIVWCIVFAVTVSATVSAASASSTIDTTTIEISEEFTCHPSDLFLTMLNQDVCGLLVDIAGFLVTD